MSINVGDRTQLVDGLEGPTALQARLERQQEEDGDRHEDEVVHPGLDRLHQLAEGERLDGSAQRGEGDDQAGEEEQDEEPRPHAQGEDRASDPGARLGGAVGDRVELAADPREARAGEADLDPLAEQLDRAGDGGGVEAAMGHP